jgi:hypothetical protein
LKVASVTSSLKVAAELPEQRLELEGAREHVAVGPFSLHAGRFEGVERGEVAGLVGRHGLGVEAGLGEHVFVDVQAERGDAPRHAVLASVELARGHQALGEVALLVAERLDDVVGLQQQSLSRIGRHVVAVGDRDIRALACLDRERHLLRDVCPLHGVALDLDVGVSVVELCDELRNQHGGRAARPAVPEGDLDGGARVFGVGANAVGRRARTATGARGERDSQSENRHRGGCAQCGVLHVLLSFE